MLRKFLIIIFSAIKVWLIVSVIFKGLLRLSANGINTTIGAIGIRCLAAINAKNVVTSC